MIENGILRFNYLGYRGHLSLLLDGFFPTSGARTRQLFKQFIVLANDRDEITEEVIEWLKEQSGKLHESDLTAYANIYADNATKRKETEEKIDRVKERLERIKEASASTRTKDGKAFLKAEKKKYSEELKKLKEQKSTAMSSMHLSKSCFNELKRDIKLYADDIRVAEEFLK